jgi:hypothetical protein
MLRPSIPSQQQLLFLALPVWLVAMLFFPHIIAPLPPPQQLMAKAGAALSISRAALVTNRLLTDPFPFNSAVWAATLHLAIVARSTRFVGCALGLHPHIIRT